jgi:antitoxin (DNA-binding transcriptional repressor) of toxin-antitoxin stability system
MPVTASQLRADVYNLLDRVLETGEPLEVVRNGQVLRITGRRRDWLDELPSRTDVIVGDPGTLPDDPSPADWQPFLGGTP